MCRRSIVARFWSFGDGHRARRFLVLVCSAGFFAGPERNEDENDVYKNSSQSPLIASRIEQSTQFFFHFWNIIIQRQKKNKFGYYFTNVKCTAKEI